MELLIGGLAVLTMSAAVLTMRARRRRGSTDAPGEPTARDVRPHDLDGRAGHGANQWTFGT